MKRNLVLIPYLLVLVSPSVIYYIVNSYLSPFLPVFILFQLSLLVLLSAVLRKKSIIFVGTFILFLAALMQWAHFALFNYELTHGAVAAILSTNPREAMEFATLIPWTFLPVLLICSFVLFASFHFSPERFELNRKQIAGLTIFLVVSFFIKRDFLYNSQPLKTMTVFYHGQALLSDFKEKMESRKKMKLPVVSPVAEHGKQVHILVIGESSRRKSWSLYGHPRDTNKYLRKWKDELLVFTDVTSAANSTIKSLEHSLTYTRADEVVSILDVINDLGFKSFWLSNQAKYGIYDNQTTSIAESATVVKFLNSDTSNSAYDSRLIAEVESVLKDDAPKKFIVVHLMGSHYHYSRRYPPEFAVFHDGIDQKTKTINEYENSLLYSDFVLAEIIAKVAKENAYSSVFYFSDHGENLYDDGVTLGHGGFNVHRSEVEVPMVAWISPFFRSKNPSTMKRVSAKSKFPLSLFDFFPSYLDFLGAKVELQEKMSFFSTGPRKDRFIFNPEDKKISLDQLK